MSQAYYRKYRSKNLSEIVGQEHITHTLQKAVQAGKLSHAYLFTGPRGVGKTSVARILAHQINNLPYDEEKPHIDIIEIDAASNRRIDEIRDIRDKVHIAPASAKYKVYIIDEVHMLTKEAFNALLKTLEEPPAHVIFILATTEVHKLPETIISRTQRFSFKPIDDTDAVNHLADIAKQEGIAVDESALRLIARHGKGSFRDSISLLDQLASSGEAVTDEVVRQLLGVPAERAVTDLIDAIMAGDTSAALAQLETMKAGGSTPNLVAEELAKQIRAGIITKTIPALPETMRLLEQLVEVPAKHRPDAFLELAILERTLAGGVQTPESKIAAVDTVKPVTAVKAVPASSRPSVIPPASKPPKAPKTPATQAKPLTTMDTQTWQTILADIKKNYATLYGIMRMSRPSLQDGEFLLEFGFPFHLKQIEQAANRHKILTVISTHLGEGITLKTSVNAELQATQATESPVTPPNEALGSITNIFGGGEVLES